jgi:hypothetical protein
MTQETDYLIRDYADELSRLLSDAEGNDLFEKGRRLGLAQAASLLLQQAIAFGIDLDRVGLTMLSVRKDLY